MHIKVEKVSAISKPKNDTYRHRLRENTEMCILKQVGSKMDKKDYAAKMKQQKISGIMTGEKS